MQNSLKRFNKVFKIFPCFFKTRKSREIKTFEEHPNLTLFCALFLLQRQAAKERQVTKRTQKYILYRPPSKNLGFCVLSFGKIIIFRRLSCFSTAPVLPPQASPLLAYPLQGCFWHAFLKKNIFFGRLSCFRFKKYLNDPKRVASLPALPPQAFLFIA